MPVESVYERNDNCWYFNKYGEILIFCSLVISQQSPMLFLLGMLEPGARLTYGTLVYSLNYLIKGSYLFEEKGFWDF